jgi:ATP adenylyltransferase
MEALFAPWRLEYLMSDKTGGCIFCEALAADDADSLIVDRGERAFTILNRYPYANGHLMVAPRAHEARLTDSGTETLDEVIRAVSAAQAALASVYAPAGFNVGANFGRAGGAGIVDHYHFHVVPRWDGDVNFMSITAGARVIPEDLGKTRDRLRAVYSRKERLA